MENLKPWYFSTWSSGDKEVTYHYLLDHPVNKKTSEKEISSKSIALQRKEYRIKILNKV